MERLAALKALVHDAVDVTTRVVGESHASVGRSVVRVSHLFPDTVGEPVRRVEALQSTVTRGVLASVRGINRVVASLSDGAFATIPWPERPPPDLPIEADVLFTSQGVIDQLVGLLNGAVGDHLRHVSNGLDMGTVLREGHPRGPSGGPRRWVVLIHGLGTTELSWVLRADRRLGDGRATLGSMLAEAIDGEALYLRYNTGVRIEDNGRMLAQRLRERAAREGEPDEVILIGHSMGGLVARFACHVGETRRDAWRAATTHVVTIGTPHLGAPLAAAGCVAADVLRAVDLPATRVMGMLLEGRSAGIRDLRDGSSTRLGPLTADLTWILVSGTMLRDAEHVAGHLAGDLLVTVRSAEGPGAAEGAKVHTHRLGGVFHPTSQTDPRVVEVVIQSVLETRCSSRPAAAPGAVEE